MPSYYAYGLHIHSDLSLPELEPAEEKGCDVRIILSKLSPHDLEAESGGKVLSWPEVGHFVVSGGTTVTVSLHEGVGPDLARLPLLGPVLGTLLRQRGRVVLHASAVAIEGRAVAFVGHKGYGKSTTAGALHARGHPLVTDDVLPVAVGTDDVPHAWPGFPRLSMWPPAAAALGQNPSLLRSLHKKVSKKGVWAADGFAAQRTFPLGVIYVLGREDFLACEPLSPRTAFVELLRHSYCSRQLNDLEPAALSPIFRQYTRLAGAVPVRRLVRPDDLTALPDIARMVEHNLRDTIPSLHPGDSPADAPVS